MAKMYQITIQHNGDDDMVKVCGGVVPFMMGEKMGSTFFIEDNAVTFVEHGFTISFDEKTMTLILRNKRQYERAVRFLTAQGIPFTTKLTVEYARYLDEQAQDTLFFWCQECNKTHDLYSPECDNYVEDQTPTCDSQHPLVLAREGLDGFIVVAR
jgi:hypothetical protein